MTRERVMWWVAVGGGGLRGWIEVKRYSSARKREIARSSWYYNNLRGKLCFTTLCGLAAVSPSVADLFTCGVYHK